MALSALDVPADDPSATETLPVPDAIAGLLGASTLAFDRAVDASDVTLDLDHARLTLTSGALIPARVSGFDAPLEWLFVGSGKLTGEPPDDVEAEQLAYFTGSRKIDATVHQAVIIPGDRWDASALAERPSVEIDAARRGAAERYFREWAVDAEREGFGARTALIRALLGDPVGRQFAGAWIESPELGRVYYAIDPASKEPASFGAFRLYELRDFLTKRERKSEARRMGLEAKRPDVPGAPAHDGRAGDAECGRRDELLAPDLDEDSIAFASGERTLPWIRPWMAAPRRGADPQGEPPGFEPEHYDVELTLAGDELEARGVARIRLAANADAPRVVPLALALGMDVCAVEDGSGRPLAFHERDEEVLVALAEPTVAGEPLDLTVRFAGRPVLRWQGRRGLRDTIAWHPHAGRLDRATYDVTLRWPAALTLLASGTPVEGGEEGGERWTRRVLDVPTMGFSFEIDEYDVVEEHVGHVDLTFGFFRHDDKMTEGRRAEIATAVKASLLFFESRLGLLPIDRVTVVVTDRGFSQGLLGFLTLTEGALHATPPSLYDNRTGQEVRLETIAHEVAHQWWGHGVGWDSYRDQWLSEALATFSSAKFMTTIAERPEEYLERRALRRRTVLAQQTIGGQPIASAGSMLLGWRLDANFGPWVYHAVVYERGAAVFGTLAQRLGQDETWKMLRALTSAVNGRVIRTETFFRALARMSGRDLGGFVDQYVRGSGVPAVFYEYTPREDADAGWIVEGVVRQLPPARFRYAVVATESGWDVVRRFDREPDVGRWEITVPFVVDTSTDGSPSGIRGDLTIRGARSEFSIPVARRPRRLELDPHGAVLAELHGAAAGSADSLYRLGEHLLRLGRLDEAAVALRQALDAAGPSAESAETVALVRLALARLHLDRGDLPAARGELRAIDKLLPADSDFYLGERTLLEARLHVRAGQSSSAVDLLNRFVERYAIELETLSADALLDPGRATPLRFARGEMMALLAVAERGASAADASLLIRMADVAGVDMSALGTR